MLKHEHGSDQQLVIRKRVGTEMPLGDGGSNIRLTFGGDGNVSACDAVLVGGHAADALHEIGDHGLAQVGKGLLVVDADPGALATVGNLEKLALLAVGIAMGLVGANLEGGDALCAEGADDDIDGAEIEALSYERAMSGQCVERGHGDDVGGTVRHLVARLVQSRRGLRIGNDGDGDDALGHAAEMRFGNDLLEEAEAIDFLVGRANLRGVRGGI